MTQPSGPNATPAERRRALLIGGTVSFGGLVLAALAVYVLTDLEGWGWDLVKGFVALAGLTGLVLGIFIWLLPALLPAK